MTYHFQAGLLSKIGYFYRLPYLYYPDLIHPGNMWKTEGGHSHMIEQSALNTAFQTLENQEMIRYYSYNETTT